MQQLGENEYVFLQASLECLLPSGAAGTSAGRQHRGRCWLQLPELPTLHADRRN